MKKTLKNTLKISLLIIMTLLFIGCGKYPEQELTTAQNLRSEMITIESDYYLPDEFTNFNDSLNIAIDMIGVQKSKSALFRNFNPSIKILDNVIVLGEKLKMDTKEKAKSILSEIKLMQAENNNLFTNLPAGKDDKDAIEAIKSELELIDGSLIELTNMFDNNQFENTFDKLTFVKEQVIAKNIEIKDVLTKAGISF